MQRLKFWTTTFLIFGTLLLLGLPFLMVAKPRAEAPHRDRLVYLATFTGYVILLLVVFFALAVLAYRIMVKQRESFREATIQNMKDLVEGTLHDHDQKSGPI